MQLENHVGKLAEVLYVPPFEPDELSQFMAAVRRLVNGAQEQLVFCCDWRRVELFDTTQADAIVWTMRRDNPMILANAVLAPSAKLYAQVEHILRDAANPRRRVFRTIAELSGYLDPLLTDEERMRRAVFLDRRASIAPSSRGAPGT
jgi:hypothetical protein